MRRAVRAAARARAVLLRPLPGRWNHRHASDSPAESSALDWSITAMRETTGRLGGSAAGTSREGFAVIGEAVWRVTIVDAALMRYRPETYSGVLARQDAGQRRMTEETFAGLRFVRNRMGYDAESADFIQPLDAVPAPAGSRLEMEISPRTCARRARAARAGLGDDAIPGIQAQLRPARRGDVRPGHGFPRASPLKAAASAAPSRATTRVHAPFRG